MGTTVIKESFEIVYEKYFSDIYNFIYGQILHRERAEDLVSDTFLKAMTNYDRLDRKSTRLNSSH